MDRCVGRALLLVGLLAIGSTVLRGGTISLEWDPSPDPDVVGYRILFGNEPGVYTGAIDVGLATAWVLSGLEDCATHCVAASAVDVDGLESELTAAVCGLPRPRLDAVTPQAVHRDSDVELTIEGANFEDGALVVLDEPAITVSSIDTVSCFELVVEFNVPADVPVGASAISVVNPDGVFARVNGALTIVEADDVDQDGVRDSEDNCEATYNPLQADGDGDGPGDACDNCPLESNAGQTDVDEDHVGDPCDNCPDARNARQRDLDGDAQGDACDLDDDGDGVEDVVDNCPDEPNPVQGDAEDDGVGDVCDNCPEAWNAGQADGDGDHVGDPCDNCSEAGNASQADLDGDARGDVCDLDDGLVYVTFYVSDSVSWQPELGFDAWNLYLGGVSALKAGDSTPDTAASGAVFQSFCGLGQSFCEHQTAPAPGEAEFFLVTGVASGAEGDLGDGYGTIRVGVGACP